LLNFFIGHYRDKLLKSLPLVFLFISSDTFAVAIYQWATEQRISVVSEKGWQTI